MPLKEGTRLGPYEILAPIGAGGMGEVYRARDTRLGRTVAIKVLTVEAAASPARRQRLEREARTISQLSHPHICALYDVGHQDGIDFLVMEYLEGETLGDRLRKGPLPIDGVLDYAVQIAGALDKAHRHGVTHRDLKPGNIMLTATGAKLLDFGLAKLDAVGDPGAALLTAAPTQDKPLTAEGALLGTFRYMAPEQLEGKEADARADIWALGLVIHEMATGKSVFQGSSQASLIAAIMERDPPRLATLRPETPPPLDRLVQRCLVKDPDERWQSTRDLLIELKWIRESSSGTSKAGAAAGATTPRSGRHMGHERILWAALLIILAAGWILSAMIFDQPTGERRIARFSLPVRQENADIENMQVSPDGRFVSYAADSEGQTHIWLRPIDSLEARPIPGTESARASFHFWSPDSRSIGFIAGGQLKTIDIDGGPADILAEVPGSGPFRLGTWNQNGTILYNVLEAPGREGLYRVSETGGDPTRLKILDESGAEAEVYYPRFLPDGRHFLFLHGTKEAIYVGSLESGTAFKLLDVPSYSFYVPPGYLLYARGGSLFAHRFDPEALRLIGEPIRIVERISTFGETGEPSFSASSNGVLVYFSGGSPTQLVWRDRNGTLLGQVGDPAHYGDMRLSPDGKRLMIGMADLLALTRDLWIIELARGVSTRFTSDAYDTYGPVWSPDGGRVAFSQPVDNPPSLFLKSIGGGDQAALLPADGTMQWASDWSPDGRYLLFSRRNPETSWDLWVLPIADGREPVPLMVTRFAEGNGQFSPDGRWVAFESDEAGMTDVYVMPFEDPGEKHRVSTSGGHAPRWRRDGKELFYVSKDNWMMSVPVTLDGGLDLGRPTALFAFAPDDGSRAVYDVTPDGQRFIINSAIPGTEPAPTVVLDWNAALDR